MHRKTSRPWFSRGQHLSKSSLLIAAVLCIAVILVIYSTQNTSNAHRKVVKIGIPQVLWQTGKGALSPEKRKAQQSWRNLNPYIRLEYHDDAAASKFILENFGSHVHELYESFPLGVMRSDFWRYAVLFVNGGIYSDADTICKRPIDQWLPVLSYAKEEESTDVETWETNSREWIAAGTPSYVDLSWDDCELVVGLEGSWIVSQWTIAAAPRHPVLRRAMEIVMERAHQGWRYDIEWWVIYHTGPNAWTWAVIDVLGLEEEMKPFCPKEKPGYGNYALDHGKFCGRELAKHVWTVATAYKRAREHKICIMGPRLWGPPKPLLVENIGGGMDPEDGWVAQQAALFRPPLEPN